MNLLDIVVCIFGFVVCSMILALGFGVIGLILDQDRERAKARARINQRDKP